MERKTHTIDAANKVLGELACQVAVLLRGKQKPAFIKREDSGDFVIVKNAKKIKYSGNKLETKIYYRHSGYLGGLKKESLGELLKRDSTLALKRAISGMLPKNKLAAKQIKRLKIEP